MKLQIKIPKDDSRSVAQITEHYLLEKRLAATLRDSQKEQRKALYSELYDELFQKIPHHPQTARKVDAEATWAEVNRKMNLVKPYLKSETVFLEIGPGDCQFSFAVAQSVQKVFAVDVSQEITKQTTPPANFELIISDGCSIPIPDQSVSVIYSNQLMEHLHPDDSLAQLKEIYRVLQPGGHYICVTPNRLAGPHDVSKYFDPIATGFHLKEYTHQELYALFLRVGFSKVFTYMGGKGVYYRFSHQLTMLCEFLLEGLPFQVRHRVANFLPIRAVLGVILVAQK
ncbi:MAG: class I SAM-dependent methyltransferase [Thermosynechococcaceae cyanobacterium MS004]|nr:class I SAM-dependent methyltransferase [Thermosynechococcaceae cyanobacterium MS004]